VHGVSIDFVSVFITVKLSVNESSLYGGIFVDIVSTLQIVVLLTALQSIDINAAYSTIMIPLDVYSTTVSKIQRTLDVRTVKIM
jgi:hypothetical protein